MTRHLLVAAAAVAAVIAAGGVAKADPPWTNPHYPDYTMHHCDGGFGVAGGFVTYYCDGTPYPDGSYWHQLGSDRAAGGDGTTPQCVVPGGTPMNPVLAAPGQCGGEYKG